MSNFKNSIQIQNKTKVITDRTELSINKYFNDISQIEAATVEEEYDLAVKAQNGDEKAKETLIKKNLRFVISIAKQYHNSGKESLSDLINEGNIGLVEAANQFDPSKGFKFISFAVWHIRKHIIQYKIIHGSAIRKPANKLFLMGKIEDGITELYQKLGRQPEFEEVVEHIETKVNETEFTALKEMINGKIDSLDREIKYDGDPGTTVGSLLPDTEGEEADHIVNESLSKIVVNCLPGILTPRELTVIEYSFGLNDKLQLGVEDLAAKIGFSKETVKLIKNRALEKIRKNMLKIETL